MNANEVNQDRTGLIAFSAWLCSLKKSRTTGWRWVQRGWLPEPIDIAGRKYLSTEHILRFEERARRGEFAGRRAGVAAMTPQQVRKAKAAAALRRAKKEAV